MVQSARPGVRTVAPDSRWSRRRVARLAATLPAVLGTACARGPRPERPAVAHTPVEIEYMHGFGDAQARPIAERFTQQYPHITVRLLNTPWAEIPNKLTTAAAAGTPPDAVMAANSDGKLYSFAHNGLIQPLEKLAGTGDLLQVKEWIHPAIWELGHYGGKLYGVAMWTQSFALVYNRAHFREAGLDPDRGPQTFEELASYAEKLTKRDAAGNYLRLGFFHEGLNQWIPVFGGQLMDPASKRLTANHPNTVRALEWLVGWIRRYDRAALKEFRAAAGSNARSAFVAEKYAMVAENSIITRQLKLRHTPLDYGVAPLPAPPNLSGLGCYTYGDIPAVTTGAREAAAAWQYVRYLSGFGTEDGGVEKYLVQPQTPVSETAYRAGAFKPVVETYAGFAMWAKALFEAKRFLFPPKIPTASGYGSILAKYVAQARDGKLTPREALNRATHEAQTEMDRAAGGR